MTRAAAMGGRGQFHRRGSTPGFELFGRVNGVILAHAHHAAQPADRPSEDSSTLSPHGRPAIRLTLSVQAFSFAVPFPTPQVSEHRLEHCLHILLTQGSRLYLYRRSPGGKWPDDPFGYINIEAIRREHLWPTGTDAVATLLALTPQRLCAAP